MNDVEQHGDERGAVVYTTRWNAKRSEPMPNSPWLTPDQARDLYLARKDFVAVDAGGTRVGALHPRWVIGFTLRGVRVRFFTPGGGSNEQSTDYVARDERLWRWTTTRYVYPDDSRYYRQNDNIRMYRARFEPDGTGTVEFTERGNATGERAQMTDAPVSGFWLDWPDFGQWADLVNMDYGLPEDQADFPTRP